MRKAIALPLSTLFALGACKSGDGPAQGTERGPCYPNGTCNAGLTCFSGVCVDAGQQDRPAVDSGSSIGETSGWVDAATSSAHEDASAAVVPDASDAPLIQDAGVPDEGNRLDLASLMEVAGELGSTPPSVATGSCGDGLVVDEECDDGNTVAGDGCSAVCTIESGWTCKQPEIGERMMVPAVYRDFRFTSASAPNDFQVGVVGSAKASPGMVEAALDADGKPVFTGIIGGAIKVGGKESFATWYRNTDGVNHATASTLALWDNGKGGYVNRYGANGEQWVNTAPAYYCGTEKEAQKDASDQPIPCTSTLGKTDCDKMKAEGKELYKCINTNGNYSALFVVSKVDGTPVFFPVDGDPFSKDTDMYVAQIPPSYDPAATWPKDVDASGNVILHNFSFTSEIRSWFRYEAGKPLQLDFVSGDDLWVFINKKLAVDLGGIHMPVGGSVTIDATSASKFGITDGKVYEIAVFQAERQTTSSVLMLTLPPFNLSPSRCTPL